MIENKLLLIGKLLLPSKVAQGLEMMANDTPAIVLADGPQEPSIFRLAANAPERCIRIDTIRSLAVDDWFNTNEARPLITLDDTSAYLVLEGATYAEIKAAMAYVAEWHLRGTMPFDEDRIKIKLGE